MAKKEKRDCVHCGFAMGEKDGEPICDHCPPKKITEVPETEPIMIHTKHKEPQIGTNVPIEIGTHKDLEMHGLSQGPAKSFMPG